MHNMFLVLFSPLRFLPHPPFSSQDGLYDLAHCHTLLYSLFWSGYMNLFGRIWLRILDSSFWLTNKQANHEFLENVLTAASVSTPVHVIIVQCQSLWHFYMHNMALQLFKPTGVLIDPYAWQDIMGENYTGASDRYHELWWVASNCKGQKCYTTM